MPINDQCQFNVGLLGYTYPWAIDIFLTQHINVLHSLHVYVIGQFLYVTPIFSLYSYKRHQLIK